MSFVPPKSFPSTLSSGNSFVTKQPNSFLQSPSLQMEQTSKYVGQNIQHPSSMGAELMQLHRSPLLSQPVPGLTRGSSLFVQNYVSPEAAQQDHKTILQNAQQVQQNINVIKQRQISLGNICHVYPPLLIRYDGGANANSDTFVPVKVLKGGELHITNQVPDMIINFHQNTGAITLTVCHIDPHEYNNLMLSIVVLYSMKTENEEGLTVKQFTVLYDQTRYDYLIYLKNLPNKS